MSTFEEQFKTRAQDSDADRARLNKMAEAQQKRGTSLIDVTRARNLCKLLWLKLSINVLAVNHFFTFQSIIFILISAITLRKIDKTTDEICQAVYSYDLASLPLEFVEMLPRFIPNEMELKAFKSYERTGKSFDDLTNEDKFMWLVSW